MKNTNQDTYRTLKALAKMILILSSIIIILFLYIRWDENAPLWIMILAVLFALLDAFFVIGYGHMKDDYTQQLKERKKADE